MTTVMHYDVIVIGGGPAGAVAAMEIARRGMSVLVLERTPFPRFHIGESFLPRNYQLICELGLQSRLEHLPHVRKFGAEFGFGHAIEPTSLFDFSDAMGDVGAETFNIERAPFDAMLLDAARDAGAVVRTDQVKSIVRLEEGDVAIRTEKNDLFTGRVLVDASGQATVVGRHLNTRHILQHHRKVAYFGHFQGVHRLSGREAGHPTVAMCEEGWFWLIPIDEMRTSIGLVLDADVARNVNIRADQMLAWGIERCPLIRQRTSAAVFPDRNGVIADFSYRCEPFAGPGYFLIGDAATFIDPIFSTGICLGMMSGVEAAKGIEAMLKRDERPDHVRRQYRTYVRRSSTPFFRLVELFYSHSFRELFLHGRGPLEIHRAVIGILAGQVFPKPPFQLKWRLWLFEWFVRLNRLVPLAPRRRGFSLVDNAAPAGNL